jgi:hypothetical protein
MTWHDMTSKTYMENISYEIIMINEHDKKQCFSSVRFATALLLHLIPEASYEMCSMEGLTVGHDIFVGSWHGIVGQSPLVSNEKPPEIS